MKLTNQKQSAQSISNGSANQTDNSTSSNNEELVKKIEIENTPFTAIWYKEEWNLLLGKYRIAGPFKEENEVMEAAKDTSWDTLLKVMQALIEGNMNWKERQEIATKLNNNNQNKNENE